MFCLSDYSGKLTDSSLYFPFLIFKSYALVQYNFFMEILLIFTFLALFVQSLRLSLKSWLRHV